MSHGLWLAYAVFGLVMVLVAAGLFGLLPP